MPTQFARRGEDVLQVSGAIAVFGRTDGNELHLAVVRAFARVGTEA